jgi:hypothetical protein
MSFDINRTAIVLIGTHGEIPVNLTKTSVQFPTFMIPPELRVLKYNDVVGGCIVLKHGYVDVETGKGKPSDIDPDLEPSLKKIYQNIINGLRSGHFSIERIESLINSSVEEVLDPIAETVLEDIQNLQKKASSKASAENFLPKHLSRLSLGEKSEYRYLDEFYKNIGNRKNFIRFTHDNIINKYFVLAEGEYSRGDADNAITLIPLVDGPNTGINIFEMKEGNDDVGKIRFMTLEEVLLNCERLGYDNLFLVDVSCMSFYKFPRNPKEPPSENGEFNKAEWGRIYNYFTQKNISYGKRKASKKVGIHLKTKKQLNKNDRGPHSKKIVRKT